MGNSGGSSPYVAPPPTPMPIEDSIAAKHEAAALAAARTSSASRSANDLNGRDTSDTITRGDLAKADSFTPQPPVRGPKMRKAPGSNTVGGLQSSAVLTG